MTEKIEISQNTIIKTLGIMFVIWLFSRIWQILLILFVSFIIMAALKPLVTVFEKLRISRAWSIVLVYILVWSGIGAVIAAIVPPLVVQTRSLIVTLPLSLNSFQFFNLPRGEITGQLLSLMGSLPENVLKLALEVFGNLVNLITTLVISFYLMTERHNLENYLRIWLSQKRSETIAQIISDVETRLGGWVRGELTLMLAVGVLTYIGLRILGVNTALPLAILAGLLEVIPNIGPILSAVPAVIFALTINPLVAVSTIALYFLVQNLENSFLVPLVMRKATGVNPLISLLGLLIGFELAGVAGTILAIPTILILETVGSHIVSPVEFPDKVSGKNLK